MCIPSRYTMLYIGSIIFPSKNTTSFQRCWRPNNVITTLKWLYGYKFSSLLTPLFKFLKMIFIFKPSNKKTDRCWSVQLLRKLWISLYLKPVTFYYMFFAMPSLSLNIWHHLLWRGITLLILLGVNLNCPTNKLKVFIPPISSLFSIKVHSALLLSSSQNSSHFSGNRQNNTNLKRLEFPLV